MFSCKQQVVERPVYTNIDLSWGNGWTKIISVFIDSTKNVKISIDEINKKSSFYNVCKNKSFNKHRVNQEL